MEVGPVDVYIIGFRQQVHGPYSTRDRRARGQRDDPRPRPALRDEGRGRRRDDARDRGSRPGGAAFAEIDITEPGSLNEEDADEVSEDLAANSSALLVAFENVWARKVVSALEPRTPC